MWTQEEIFYSTVRISVGKKSGSIGTGFLVKYPLPDNPDLAHWFIVTAKHVLNDIHDDNVTPSQQIQLNFNKLDLSKEDPAPLSGEYISIETLDFREGYFQHPNIEIDLACIHISNLIEITKEHNEKTGKIFWRGINLNDFATYNEEWLLPGLRIWIVGYPHGQFDHINNLPLMKVGHISSLPKSDYQGKPEFLVDASIHPGISGAPVYGIAHGRGYFLGVVTQYGRFPETIEGNKELKIYQRLNIGYVIKSIEVQVLLDHAFNKLKQINQS